MSKHIKPTVKELDEKINENLKAIDEDVEKESEEGKKIEKKSKEELQEPEEVKEPIKEEEEEPEEPPKKEEPKEEPKQDPYKKRYEDSTREAQVLYAKSKKMSDAIAKAGEIQEPTEEQLKVEFPEWDEMSAFEQRMGKESLMNRLKLEAIGAVAKDFKDMDSWNKKIDDFLADPEVLAEHPELEGREGDFKIFASKDTRRGVDFSDLVSAFLYTAESSPKPVNKGKMFETGSGGDNQRPKKETGKITFEEGQKLKDTNYKLYIRMLKENKIEAPEV